MAIDSTLFAVDIPAGNYNPGDIVNLGCIAGPASVRSGRGAATLKQIFAGRLQNTSPFWEIHVKNSDWIDEAISYAGPLSNDTTLDDHSGCIQFGCDNALGANSGWYVYAKCVFGGTSTVGDSVFCIIDVDYPAVSAVVDPDNIIGIPTTIPFEFPSINANAAGAMVGAAWSTVNVDYFKAGYEYCLQAVEAVCSGAGLGGFVAFSNAAGMGGLQRIVPINISVTAIRSKIRYSSKLLKGPMDIKAMVFNNTAGPASVYLLNDYVKRGA